MPMCAQQKPLQRPRNNATASSFITEESLSGLQRQRRRSPTAPLELCWHTQVTYMIAVNALYLTAQRPFGVLCDITAISVWTCCDFFFISLHSRLSHSFAFPLVSIASIKDLRGLGFLKFVVVYTSTRFF